MRYKVANLHRNDAEIYTEALLMCYLCVLTQTV